MEQEELDWPTDIPIGKDISSFEENLLCPICQDFYNNPQILKCGHSFCSLCIRRHFDRSLNLITYDICPACREKSDSFDLRKNVPLANLVEKYNGLRKHLHRFIITSSTNNNTNHLDLTASPVNIKSSKRNQNQTVPRGAVITTRIAQYNFHGMSKDKVRKVIDDVTKQSRIKLRTDGDKDALERRLRELIHLINAQLGANHPMTLDEVVNTINQNEQALEKSRKRKIEPSVRYLYYTYLFIYHIVNG